MSGMRIQPGPIDRQREADPLLKDGLFERFKKLPPIERPFEHQILKYGRFLTNEPLSSSLRAEFKALYGVSIKDVDKFAALQDIAARHAQNTGRKLPQSEVSLTGQGRLGNFASGVSDAVRNVRRRFSVS